MATALVLNNLGFQWEWEGVYLLKKGGRKIKISTYSLLIRVSAING